MRGRLKKADLSGLLRSGSRTEKLPGKMLRGNGGAVHLDQRPPGGKTLRVDGGRGNALSCPGFPGDEHGHIRAGDLTDTFAQGAHGRAFAQQQIAGRRAALVFKIAVFQFQASLEAVQFGKTLGIGQRHGQIVGHKAQLV